MKNIIYLFFYGLTSSFRISLVGQIGISEMFALLYFPFSEIRKIFRCYPYLVKATIAYASLLLSLILSDIYNVTDPNDYLRGWASVIFSFISTWFIINQIHKNIHLCVYFLIGLFITKLLWGGGGDNIDLSVMEENTNYFKARIMEFTNPAILTLSYIFFINKYKSLALVILFSYAITCIFLDARSNSMAFFIASILLFLKVYNIKMQQGKMLFWGCVIIVIGYFAYVYYVDQVLYHDFGGKNAKIQLGMTSNPYNPFELLYYGRTSTFLSLEAIGDNPIWGYGSWGKSSDEHIFELLEQGIHRDYTIYSSYIPSHSVILTAWLWGGILGFISILYLFFIFLKMGFKIYQKGKDIAILIILMPLFLGSIWDFLFSPIGHLRVSLPFILALVIKSYHLLPDKKTIYMKSKRLKKSIAEIQ